MARTYHATVLRDLTPDDVTCGTLRSDGSRGFVDLGDDVTLHGTIAELRAVAVEIDRQLARLEVEHRIDQATKCDTCDGTGTIAHGDRTDGVLHTRCPDCGGTGQ